MNQKGKNACGIILSIAVAITALMIVGEQTRRPASEKTQYTPTTEREKCLQSTNLVGDKFQADVIRACNELSTI